MVASIFLYRYALENDLLGNLPGKTPEATMASACYTDLKKKDVNKRVFARPSEGHFGLREWANDPELTHLLQPKLHMLAETFEEEQKPKVEKPWKQPAPMAKRKNNTAAKKFVDGKPRRDRHGFVHAIIEPSRGEYGPPKMQMPAATAVRIAFDARYDGFRCVGRCCGEPRRRGRLQEQR